MAVHRDINMGDNVYWTVPIHNFSGMRQDATFTPRFYVLEESSDSPVYEDEYTKRTFASGLYVGFFPLLESSGFGVGKYFDVITSGEIENRVGWDVWSFKSVSGSTSTVDANLISITGMSVTYPFLTDVVQITGQPIQYPLLSNLTLATGTPIEYPFTSDAPSAATIADAVWDEDMSGHTAGNTFGSGVGDAVLPIFYADVKYTFDKNEPRDEYTATWYRNAVRVVSGDLESNIYIKALKRSDGSDLFATQTMDITNLNPAVFVHSETGVAQRLTAGEAAVVELSGTFAGENKVWYKIITRDSGVL